METNLYTVEEIHQIITAWHTMSRIIDDYLFTSLYDYDNDFGYEYMKIDEPDSFSQGELEYLLADDLAHYLSLRTKTMDVFVNDVSDVIKYVEGDMDSELYCLNIHWNENSRKFIIIKSDEEQFFYYKVGIEIENKEIKYLGSSMYSESILDIIEYYKNTGQALGIC